MVNKFYISHECTVVETLGITVRVFVLDAVKKLREGHWGLLKFYQQSILQTLGH